MYASPTLQAKGLRTRLALVVALAASSFIVQADEVPFITSPDNVTLEMLQIAGVGADDHVIDLGSGDGRIVIVAAKRFGATGEGVEIVPDLVARSQASAREAGVSDRVKFHQKDLFSMDLAPATVVTMYLLPEFNLKLRPALLALKPGTRIVSHDWDMGDWQPDRTVVVPVPNKQVGMEKSSKVHFWVVPAPVQGLWCGAGLLEGATLNLVQRFQSFDGTLVHRKRTRALSGRIDGGQLTTASKRGDLTLEVKDNEMRLASAEGVLALARGASFKRAAGNSCS
jgi:SAM-dependent methyltransferase